MTIFGRMFSYVQSLLSDCVRPWAIWWSTRKPIHHYRMIFREQNYSVRSMSSMLTEANPTYKTPTKSESQYFDCVTDFEAQEEGLHLGRSILLDSFSSLDYISHLTICNNDPSRSRLGQTISIDFRIGNYTRFAFVHTMHITDKTEFDENNCVVVPIHAPIRLLSSSTSQWFNNIPTIFVLDSSSHHTATLENTIFGTIRRKFYTSPAICVTAHGTNFKFSLRQILDMSDCIFEHDHDNIYQRNKEEPPYTSFLLYSGQGCSARWLPDTRDQIGLVLK